MNFSFFSLFYIYIFYPNLVIANTPRRAITVAEGFWKTRKLYLHKKFLELKLGYAACIKVNDPKGGISLIQTNRFWVIILTS